MSVKAFLMSSASWTDTVCISCPSDAVLEHQDHVWKRVMPVPEGNSPPWQGCLGARYKHGLESRWLRVHMLNHKHEAEKMSWRKCEALNSQSPPHMTKGCTSSSKATPPKPPQAAPQRGTKCSNTQGRGEYFSFESSHFSSCLKWH